MSCEGWERCTAVLWPDKLSIQCPKCGCDLCVDVSRIELTDSCDARILWICGHYGCGYTWWSAYKRAESEGKS